MHFWSTLCEDELCKQAAPRPRGRVAAWGRRKPDSAPAESDPPTGRWRSGGKAPPRAAESGRAPCVGAGVQPEPKELPQGSYVGVPLAGCPTVGLADGQGQGARARIGEDEGVQPARRRVALATIESPCRPFRRWKVSPSTVSFIATGCKPVALAGWATARLRAQGVSGIAMPPPTVGNAERKSPQPTVHALRRYRVTAGENATDLRIGADKSYVAQGGHAVL